MLDLTNLEVEIASLARDLPPFPKIVIQLLDLLRNEDASLDELARLAKNDPVISSNILGTANRLRRMQAKSDIDDPFIAASLIGVNQVRRIVSTVGMNKFLGDGKGNEFLFNHSRAVAIVAQELAMLCGVSPEKAYVVGILHDIGQLCFHIRNPDVFQALYQKSAVDGQLLERETAVFGLDHAKVGALLADFWRLPDDFVYAIQSHHDDTVVKSKLQAVINIAESLTRALDIPASPKNRLNKLNVAAIESLGIVWDSPAMMDCFGRCRARFRQGMT